MSGIKTNSNVPADMNAIRIHRTAVLCPEYSGLQLDRVAVPVPADHELLIRVQVCGVCHTELDEIEGRATPSEFPMTPGHQVIGTIVLNGPNCSSELIGQTVGVAWIHSCCGECNYCQDERENLCSKFQACGKDKQGGYAEYMVIPEDFAYLIPQNLPLTQAAPLLCAGAVGLRSLRMAQLEDGDILGLTGFGSSGRLVLQMARILYPKSPVYVFARSEAERAIADRLGASWTGVSSEQAPQKMTAIIDTTPVWLPVLNALEQLQAGGRLVINAIRKENTDQDVLLKLNYAEHMWYEKTIQSVANVSRKDVRGVLELASQNPLRIDVVEYALEQALDALLAIKSGDIEASSVLTIAQNSGTLK